MYKKQSSATQQYICAVAEGFFKKSVRFDLHMQKLIKACSFLISTQD